jgi:SOS-response transcriptional repressor LexA
MTLMTAKRATVEAVFDFIVAYKREHDGNSPTIREIMLACGISSTSMVVFYLNKLERRGIIRRPEPVFGARYANGIEVVGGKWTPGGEHV